ncbi:T9SS type A sorting domain-containing protein [Lacinutrix sp. WUR7]|uniref:T9SS type A sorting domain-containing protein n=1 Tax=Lacinutrix sp. WUR7 TaxID=2653681 RepID=UPI00193D0CAD|nr:T9SS type A sorting domain-containing protein [Lacinutrix sp. WUR7]QRM88964.1 T9SS type A sorting domain-containing protein [Lacinutrix sp. WUR7]
MKKITFSLFIFLLVSQVTVYAQEQSKSIGSNASSKVFEPTPATLESINQTGFARCLTVENEAILKQKYPERLSSDEFEAWLAPKVEQVKANRATNRTVYNIPVVIHIIHDGDALGTGENITDAQAISQITVMNEDYRKLTGTRGGANTTGAAVDTEINFCLANTDVNGAATTGVVRHVIAPYSNNVANDITTQPDWETTADVESMKTATQWDPTKYLNMWVIRPGGLPLNQGGLSGLLGYAQFPSNSGLNGAPAGGAASTDGVVAGYNAMGTKDLDDGTFILNNSYEYGRTMTHEVGHWLGLRHIWGDGPESGSCGYDDYCDDTPNAEQPNYNCGSVTSCGSADQYQNYMDYSYDTCMDTFTQDQMDRIQTVMTNSPRRMELNSSTACSTSPTIYFESSPSGDLDEGSDCDYIDYTISFALTDGGSANSTVSLIASGTATENEDFELLNNSVTFASGATTASNSITLRIHQDSFVETDETLELSINLSTTGDAEATASTKSITIINDDTAASASGSAVIFEDGFESYTDFDFAPIGDWTMLDVDGNSTFGSNSATWTNTGYTGTFMVFNPSQTTPSLAGTIWDPHTGSKGYYCFDATNNPNGTALNDDYIFTPQMQNFGANGELKLWAKSLTDQYGLERFKVGVSTTDTNPASFTYFTASYAEAPIDWTEYTYDLSAYQGEDIYITIYVESSDAFTFMLDDISVTADVTTVIQETINTATADQLNITGPGEAFAFDATSKNLMLSIDNFGGFAYECTNVNVSRDVATVGAASTMYSANTDPSSFVSAKTFDITTTIQNTADASTLSFYFTEAELAGWESETGNSRTSLYVKKEGTNEVVPVTVTAFGADLELTASFTTGLEGTYVFGVQTALSTTNALTLDTGVSIYPNPSSSALNIKTSDNNLPDTYVIYNMLGQVMSNKTISNNSDLSINTSALSNGMYFIKISKEGNTVSLPFVKK